MMVGPLFAGLLREALGYYYMNCIIGEFNLVVVAEWVLTQETGLLCLGVAVSSFVYITERPVSLQKQHSQEE
jgi:hypothetical protein